MSSDPLPPDPNVSPNSSGGGAPTTTTLIVSLPPSSSPTDNTGSIVSLPPSSSPVDNKGTTTTEPPSSSPGNNTDSTKTTTEPSSSEAKKFHHRAKAWAKEYNEVIAVGLVVFAMLGFYLDVKSSMSELNRSVEKRLEDGLGKARAEINDDRTRLSNDRRATAFFQRVQSLNCEGDYPGTIEEYKLLKENVDIDTLSPDLGRMIYKQVVIAYAWQRNSRLVNQKEIDLLANRIGTTDENCGGVDLEFGMLFLGLAQPEKATEYLLRAYEPIRRGKTLADIRILELQANIMLAEIAKGKYPTAKERAEAAILLYQSLLTQNSVGSDILIDTIKSKRHLTKRLVQHDPLLFQGALEILFTDYLEKFDYYQEMVATRVNGKLVFVPVTKIKERVKVVVPPPKKVKSTESPGGC